LPLCCSSMLRPCLFLLALRATTAYHMQPPARCKGTAKARALASYMLEIRADPIDASTTGAATGEDMEKTDGIPNYMLRNSGTVTRVADGSGASIDVIRDGVLYETGQLVSIVTSDVIDMVQQQGGSATKVDFLGENILVDGLLFDDFKVNDTFEIAPLVAADDGSDVVSLEIVEQRKESELELDQLGDDNAKRQSISSLLGLSPGLSGWTARVVVAGRVRADFKIAKLPCSYVAEA